jgi:Arc/MetJ family transcription regulator
MRTTVTLDDDLLCLARTYTGIQEATVLIQTALKTLVELEASRRLARLGGSDPNAKAAPRRRTKPVDDPS